MSYWVDLLKNGRDFQEWEEFKSHKGILQRVILKSINIESVIFR